MALSHGMVTLGRFALILLLYLKLISICLNVVSCIVLGHWTFTVGILLILSTVTLHIVVMISFGEAWTCTWETALLLLHLVWVYWSFNSRHYRSTYTVSTGRRCRARYSILANDFCQSSLYHTIYFAALFEHCWRRRHRISRRI